VKRREKHGTLSSTVFLKAVYGKMIDKRICKDSGNKWHRVVDGKGFGRRLVVTVSVA